METAQLSHLLLLQHASLPAKDPNLKKHDKKNAKIKILKNYNLKNLVTSEAREIYQIGVGVLALRYALVKALEEREAQDIINVHYLDHGGEEGEGSESRVLLASITGNRWSNPNNPNNPDNPDDYYIVY